MAEHEEEIVVTPGGRLAGCRGRVRVALVLLAILFLILLAILVRAMLAGTPPQPVKRASAASVPASAALGDAAIAGLAGARRSASSKIAPVTRIKVPL